MPGGWIRCLAAGISIAVSGGSHDTGRVLVKDIEGARAALRAGRPVDLLGLAECGWLDAKAGVYRLDDPAKALELAKDAAAFANTGTGGMILAISLPSRRLVSRYRVVTIIAAAQR
jgi:hypothetical protein